MEEIKVRGYSEGYNEWIYGWGLANVKLNPQFAKETGVEYVSYIYNDHGKCSVVTDSVGSYAGINDNKSNKEIYAGDFVKVHFVLTGQRTDSFFGEVEMLEGQWVINNGSEAIPLWSDTNELEVVGDKYELVIRNIGK